MRGGALTVDYDNTGIFTIIIIIVNITIRLTTFSQRRVNHEHLDPLAMC